MRFPSRRWLLAAAAFSLALPFAGTAAHAQAWPDNKPIRLVVGFAPGGFTGP